MLLPLCQSPESEVAKNDQNLLNFAIFLLFQPMALGQNHSTLHPEGNPNIAANQLYTTGLSLDYQNARFEVNMKRIFCVPTPRTQVLGPLSRPNHNAHFASLLSVNN